MTTHDSNDELKKGKSPYLINLQLGKKIQDEGMINSFVKDTRTNNIIIELNHIYDQTKVIVSINTKKWEKILKSIEEQLKDKGIGISDYHIRLIKNVINDNHELIAGITSNNNPLYDLNCQIGQYNKISKDSNNNSYDHKNQSNQKQQESQQQDIPLLSVLEAKRSSEGLKKVIGRIVGRSTNFKVISNSEWRCQNIDCQNRGSLSFYPPIYHLPKNLDNTSGSNPPCFVCRTFGSINVIHQYKNAKIIQLDDIDTIEEKFDRLDVIMYDDASNRIIDGEVVEIEGDLRTQKRISSSRASDSSKLFNILHSDKPIVYKNKKEIKITEKDIENCYNWKTICHITYKKESEVLNKYSHLKEEDRPDWVKKIKPMTFEQRVTTMFAPNVYGNADKKMGILRSIVGGSRVENGIENGRRGRIHTLMIGDPGTAKTSLGVESTKLNQNSRIVDASGASGKSLVGIVDKENDSLMVKYGVVVAAKNSHVVINEAGSMSYDDQWHFVGIAEEGITTLDKYGEHIPIDAPTTLIFTANPIGTKWKSNKMTKEELTVIKPNLLDRLDQKYGFFDNQTEEEMEDFIDKITKIKNRKPHNYNFLIKYLQYVKTIEPKWVGNAERRLNRFWINIRSQGIEHNRSFFSIKRIAEAQAKLNLSYEVDDIIASKTMQSLQLMFMQYGKIIEQIQNPRDLTVEVFYNLLKESNTIGYTVGELCQKGSEKSKQVKEYLKQRWDFEHNKELRTIIGMLEQKQGIKITSLRPRVFVYSSPTITKTDKDYPPPTVISDLSDLSDQLPDDSFEKKIENFHKDMQIERTDRSDRSDSKEEESITDVKLVNISVSKKGKPIEMTKEQYDSWTGNENENEGDEI